MQRSAPPAVPRSAPQAAPRSAPRSAPAAAPVPAQQYGWYQQAHGAGKKVYAIDPAQSLITVTVRRGGVLARLGHDHVVASRAISGFVAPDDGRADFQFRLDQMTVDEPALRRKAGLDTQPPAEAVEGTRRNMLGRVLEAERFPLVLLRARRVAGAMRLTVTLHGVSRDYVVPTRLERSAGGVTASGALTLLQTDFGIVPMSIMGGAMQVRDPLELTFRVVARAPGPRAGGG
ncbi:YceI family protein [Massilia glaciei]|uniref:YceI family protein n=1 Tax=Massilia glaciei TaxID=1524097 RepID=UPI001E487F18|nr:YceI family protein [Massilia glaciei]